MIRLIRSFVSVLLSFGAMALASPSFSQTGISVAVAPPALPVLAYRPNWISDHVWMPNDWVYGSENPQWIPGTWIMLGVLETPGYLGGAAVARVWRAGYGKADIRLQVTGLEQIVGEYDREYQPNGVFSYSPTLNKFSSNSLIKLDGNVSDTSLSAVRYSGGRGAITAQEQPIPAPALQIQNQQAARTNHPPVAPSKRGKSAIAAIPKPGDFSHGVVPGKDARITSRGSRLVNSSPNLNTGRGSSPSHPAATRPRSHAPDPRDASAPSAIRQPPQTAALVFWL